MGGDPWNIKPSDDGKLPTILENSTLDRSTVTDIASGRRPFPNYSDIPLTPQRRLLHEVIIQVVTERQLVGQSLSDPHDARLHAIVENVTHTPAYRQMLAHGEVNAEKVSELLDSFGVKRLPTVDASARTTVMMATGGPATGKSALVASLATAHPEIYRNSAIVNSDDYKPLLADPKVYGAGYANASHAESAYLSDEIMARLSHKIDAGRAPNVVLDVVTLSEQRMAFAKKSGNLIVATGTAPPDVTLDRSHQRGIESGRIVPSEAVLAGARAVSETTPRIFEHPNARMELFDTNVPFRDPNKLVARYEPGSRTLFINEPDVFVDFVERQKLNPKAHNASELFRSTDRSPAAIAHEMKAYTDKGVTLAFLNPQGELAMTVGREGVDQIRPLTSQRGNAFFAELAGAATALVGRHAVDPNQRGQVEEHAPGEPRKTQNPVPIIVPQNERTQTPPPVLVNACFAPMVACVTSFFALRSCRKSRGWRLIYEPTMQFLPRGKTT